MGETLQSVIPGFNRSLRIASRADRLTCDPWGGRLARGAGTQRDRVVDDGECALRSHINSKIVPHLSSIL